MQKKILDLYFDVNFSIPIVLVLEPVDTIWNSIYRIADALIDSLPGRINKLYFLGQKKCYTVFIPRDFRDNSPNWFVENKNRPALINPILEELEKEGFNGMVVVICSMPPVDIEDWQGRGTIERVIFVKVGEEAFGGNYNIVDSRLGTGRIISELNNPLVDVFISGSSFVPLCYKPDIAINATYRKGEFVLNIDPSCKQLQLHLAALCSPDSLPKLYLRRKKGSFEETFTGSEEHPWFNPPMWQRVPEDLKPIITAGIEKTSFKCNQCHKEHGYDTFLCPEADIILKDMPVDTCLLFTKDRFLSLWDIYAYPLKNERIITKEGNLYEWDKDKKKWSYVHKISPYEEVDYEIWALFHRI